MSKIKRIFLVRHGESEANLDPTLLQTASDHRVSLSPRGHEQAAQTGKFLADALTMNHHKLRIWHSPYTRARQTAQDISLALSAVEMQHTMRESVLLCEQQFGLFDGLSAAVIAGRYPNEYAHYTKCMEGDGRFWARMPQGESRFDVVQRVHQFMGTLYRDLESSDIDSLIIVGHGITNRAFTMQWMHHTYEWFEQEPNPDNAAVRALVRGRDRGYIFTPDA